MTPCGEGAEASHNLGLVLLCTVWILLPLFLMKEPITWLKRYFLMVWYLGPALGSGLYLVLRR